MQELRERLEAQIDFLLEIDKLKQIYRQNLIVDGSRRENDVEHSWHLALFAMVLQEYSQEPVDLAKVIKMVLIHDLVEIDAGDTFCYDEEAVLSQEARELEAAERIFGLLPEVQGQEFRELWDEFEAGISPEAKFAMSLDRFQPFLNNFKTKGGTWSKHGVTSSQVKKRMAPVAESSPVLGECVKELIELACEKGLLKR